MRKEWQEKLKEKNIEINYENERKQKERKGQKFWIKIIEGKRKRKNYIHESKMRRIGNVSRDTG